MGTLIVSGVDGTFPFCPAARFLSDFARAKSPSNASIKVGRRFRSDGEPPRYSRGAYQPMRDKTSNVSELIGDARRAQPGALDRLLEAYRDYLILLARGWIGVSLQGKADPSDLVQESLLGAQRQFGQFRGGTEVELAAWLRQILARRVADLARRFRTAARQVSRERSLQQMLGNSSQALDRLLVASGTSPSQAAARRELGVVLADALAELSDDHREVIVLRNIEELDWEEVARRLGRSPGAVRTLWARALARLRPLVEARL